VRHLEPGERPKDWSDWDSETDPTCAGDVRKQSPSQTAPASKFEPEAQLQPEPDSKSEAKPHSDPEYQSEPALKPLQETQSEPALEPLQVRQRYRVQFTASEEYVVLLERARDLLSHAIPNRSIEEVHLRALRCLVTKLEKRRHAAKRSRSSKTA